MFNISFMMTGAALGLTSALSPGPIQAFLISQTIRHGFKEGMLIAFVPLMTDLPIFLIAVGLFSQIPNVEPIMGVLSLVGAFFLSYLAYGNFKITGFQDEEAMKNPDSIRKGIATNFLNPFPYMFWLLVGAPMILDAYRNLGALVAGSFILAFYSCLIGMLVVIAALVGKSRGFLKGRAYVYTIRCLGGMLILFALRFLHESLKFFGVL